MLYITYYKLKLSNYIENRQKIEKGEKKNMKTRKVATPLPILASIGFAIVVLAVPFIVANHYIFVENMKYSADSYLFFFWGKYYTVTGTNLIQSQTIMYDLGDFPIYAMMFIVAGIILGAMSVFGGRGLVLNVKGREMRLKLDKNPMWFQMPAMILLLVSYIYMNVAAGSFANVLRANGYTVESGPALDFLLGSIVAMTISILMTAGKYLKDEKVQQIGEKIIPIDRKTS